MISQIPLVKFDSALPVGQGHFPRPIKVIGSHQFGALILLSVSCDLDVSLPINCSFCTAPYRRPSPKKSYLQHSVLFAISPANATLCIRPLVKDSMSRTNWHISQCLEFFKKVNSLCAVMTF